MINRTNRTFLLLLVTIASNSFAASVEEVATEAGIYRGFGSDIDSRVTVFEGIAYAAPPTGDLRWKAPGAPLPFAGVRNADRAGPACWQARNDINSLYARGNLNRSEDCLYLNVFTGAQDSDDSLPVMVWFHGGGNTAGHAAAKIFDGSNLAARGAVVVTANYRLGAFGFLAHPALSAESEQQASGNYGLMDQIEVLQWVQNNIAAFGGDPDRVTIFGQSAGGEDVCLLMASPLTEGLVHRVIGQSPSAGCIRMERRLSQGEDSGHARGERYMEAMGITGRNTSNLQAMRDLSPQRIVSEGSPNGPIIDGWVLPDSPANLFAAATHNRIPVMMGGLADEYFGLQHNAEEISVAQLDQYLQRGFGNDADDVKTAYADLINESPLAAQKTIAGDNGFIRTARDWARAIHARGDQAYVYFFTRNPPAFRLYVPAQPDLNNDGGQRTFGAYHSGELAYVFDNLDVVGIGWDEQDKALSETVADYWFNFAATGNPNGPGLPQWRVFNPANDMVQILDTPVVNDIHPRRSFMDLMEAASAP
ncbi:MAG: carboxylesterase family protein [Gammaproteobacteria bacterium]